MAIKAGDQRFGSRYLELVGNSVTLAAVPALPAVGLAALMAYGRRLQGSPAVQLATRLAALGSAIPGTLIAAGVLVPFAASDHALHAWLRTHAGGPHGPTLPRRTAARVLHYTLPLMT